MLDRGYSHIHTEVRGIPALNPFEELGQIDGRNPLISPLGQIFLGRLHLESLSSALRAHYGIVPKPARGAGRAYLGPSYGAI